ncbi:EF-Tu/IF-2/RF-3 family GTPase [Methanocaldococcus indicus]|uniref:EF-Tu/IF-2/RF-3 family GTPase n=1 Tax=Methanocaldococcus indicus TaxID=213231 RepID=UPI003C6D79EC
MEGLTIGLFGHLDGVGRELGKKGTESDIAIYHYKVGDKLVSYVEPKRYPDKIAPLIYTINMMDYALVFVDDVSKDLGETFLTLDMFNIDRGAFVVHEYVDVDFLKEIIKNTSLKNFEILEKDFIKIREYIKDLKIERDLSYKKITIDHYFTVKSVGTVILGKVDKGIVNVYDKLNVYPIKKEALIKSIQINDVNYKEAKAGDRVGIALKGVDTEELDRGYILSDKELKTYSEITAKFELNPFLDKKIKENETYNLIVGLQNVACKVEKVNNNEITLKLNNPIVYDDEKLCLVDGSAKIRIVGVGNL